MTNSGSSRSASRNNPTGSAQTGRKRTEAASRKESGRKQTKQDKRGKTGTARKNTAGSTGTANQKKHSQRSDVWGRMTWRGYPLDRPFLITLLCLVGIGLLMVFSASMYTSVNNGDSGYSSFVKQGLFACLGVLVMLVISCMNFRVFNDFNKLKWALIIVGGLLALVLVPGIGIKVNDARRWLGYGSLTFQPSELAKIIGIMYLASLITTYPERITNWKDLFKWVLLPMLAVCGLTAMEPSLSAAMAIAVGMVAVLWFGMLNKRFITPLIVGALVATGAFIFLESWRWQRILAMFSQSTVNYQIKQSLVAFGSGGLFGVGLGNGKQKLLFLPELANDFIFANIGEEFGLVGCLIVLGLYGYLIYRGFRIAFACKNKFGQLYTCSVMTLLGFQVFVNIGVAISALPVTGMALPFISYGGTSIVVLFAMMGPIMNISRTVSIPGKRIRLFNRTVSQKKKRKKRHGTQTERGTQ